MSISLDHPSLEGLLDSFKINKKTIVIEHNGSLYKENFDKILIKENDIIDIIHFMGGG